MSVSLVESSKSKTLIETDRSARVERPEPDRKAAIDRVPLEAPQQFASDPLPLPVRVDDELADVDVVVPVFHGPVPARHVVGQDDFHFQRPPIRREKSILARMLPRSELSLDDVAIGGVVGETCEGGVGLGRWTRPDPDHGQRTRPERQSARPMAIMSKVMQDISGIALGLFFSGHLPMAGHPDRRVTKLANLVDEIQHRDAWTGGAAPETTRSSLRRSTALERISLASCFEMRAVRAVSIEGRNHGWKEPNE